MTSYSADSNAIHPYLSDESSAFEGHADRVYFPSTAAEVADVLREAGESGVPLSISGGGTSITGARVPTSGGWVLATDRLSTASEPGADEAGDWLRIPAGDGALYLDEESRRARVPAGLRLSDLAATLAPYGLFYPPTLTETSAMIGGTIATNASGARSYRYGPTRCWVDALRVVTPRGDNLWLRRGDRAAENGVLNLGSDFPPVNLPPQLFGHHLDQVKNAAGYYVRPDLDAVDLFIGGEGTLGIVTEAEVRLEPLPGEAVNLLVYVRERDAALDLADAIREGFFEPWTALAVEYFDRHSLEFMSASYAEIPAAAAAVLVELAPPEPEVQWYDGGGGLEEWESQIARYDPVDVWAVMPTEREQVRLFRHSLPDRVNDYVRTRRGKLGTDLAVAGPHFRTLMEAYDAAERAGVRTVLFGHLGEYHLHMNFLADDAAQMERAREAYTVLARRAVELGGTVSAEHGVGKKRIHLGAGTSAPYLELMFGHKGIEAMGELKRQLDPAWILNRDTLMPREEDA
jgi:D-lactate dehydrogenase (cytochrome)